jgi:CheY-like chemotaxis protein
MMRQLVEAQLRGEYRADWSPGGARVTIRLPDLVFLSRIVLSPPATGPRKGEDGAARSNPRGCVLVVEDMALLAFDIAEALRRSDWTVVGPAASVADGIALARGFGDELDCAVLDFDLSGVRSTPVAEVLRAAGVPIVWCTGFEASALDRLPEEAHLQKPIDHEQLLATVERHRPQRLPPAAH